MCLLYTVLFVFLAFPQKKAHKAYVVIREDNRFMTQAIIQGFILQNAYNYKLFKREMDLPQTRNFNVMQGRGLLTSLSLSLISKFDEFITRPFNINDKTFLVVPKH